jgi:hypothetical protein
MKIALIFEGSRFFFFIRAIVWRAEIPASMSNAS